MEIKTLPKEYRGDEETFSARMDRMSREARERFAKMTPEEQVEILDAARTHSGKVRGQIMASYEADVRAGRVNPTE